MKILVILLVVLALTGCYRHVQTHGEGPNVDGTVVDKYQYGHFYAVFGMVDVTGEKDIDGFIEAYPNCRVTTEQTIVDWLVSIICYQLVSSRTVTIEFPVLIDSDRGKVLTAHNAMMKELNWQMDDEED